MAPEIILLGKYNCWSKLVIPVNDTYRLKRFSLILPKVQYSHLSCFLVVKMLKVSIMKTIFAGLSVPIVLSQGFNLTALSAENGASVFQCWQLKSSPARAAANGIVQWPVGNAVGMDISFMPKNLVINPSKPRVPL